MKKQFSILLLGLSVFATPLFSQTKVFSVGELDPYFTEYIEPMAIGVATSMGAGWAHEAGPHKMLGFDLSLSLTAVTFPTSALTLSTSALSEMTANGYSFTNASGNVSSLPTVVSAEKANANMGKTMVYSTPAGNGSETLKVPGFDGLDIPFTFGASLQLAIGLPKGTEIIGRYVPESGSFINDYSGVDALTVNTMNSWGVGVKHDLKQWIPVVSHVPFLEISALVTYSQFNFDVTSNEFSINPQTLEDASGFNITDNSGANFANQGFAMSMESMTASLLVGANVPIIHPFIGVGFNKASVETGLTGTFPILSVNESATSGNDVFVVNEVEEAPISLEAEKTYMNFQAGINVKIAILSIHAQYTYQDYSMYSVGLAVGLR